MHVNSHNIHIYIYIYIYIYIVRLRPCGQPCGNQFHVNVTGLRRPVTSECNRSPPPHIFKAYLFVIVSMCAFAGKRSPKPQKTCCFLMLVSDGLHLNVTIFHNLCSSWKRSRSWKISHEGDRLHLDVTGRSQTVKKLTFLRRCCLRRPFFHCFY